jgi:hypothetical protein
MLLWIDGFETYNVLNQPAYASMAGRYALSTWTTYYTLHAGRWGGLSVKCAASDIHFTTLPVLTTDPTLVVGFNFFTQTLSDAVYYLPTLTFGDLASWGIRMCLRASGELTIYNSSGTTLGTTSGANIQANVWAHIEVKVYCHATAGTVTVRVNEQVKLSLTGINTKSTDDYYSRIQFRGVNSACAIRIDDLYILDGTGTRNNDFLGVKQVVALMPDGAGDNTDWTPSSGSNYACVDEIPVSDADYVQTLDDGDVDLYNFSAVAGVSGGVSGIQISTDILSYRGTPHNLRNVVKSGGTTDTGSDIAIGSSDRVTRVRVVETDPATGDAWLLAALNDAQFGIKRQS